MKRLAAALVLAPWLLGWTPLHNASSTPDNSARPALGFTGDTLHVFWEERVGDVDQGKPRVWTARREPQGAWTPSGPAFPALAQQSSYPRVIADGSSTLLCATIGDDEVQLTTLGPGGPAALTPLSQSPGRRSYTCAGASNGQTAVVAWHDNPAQGPSEWSIQARRRAAPGEPWGEVTVLSGALPGINADALVAVDPGGTAHVVFLNKTDASIHHVVWPAGGAPAPAQPLTSQPARRFWPALALDGDVLVVAWQEAPLDTDQWTIQARRLVGGVWTAPVTVSASEPALNPRLVSRASGALLAFRSFGKHQFFSVSEAAGAFAPPVLAGSFGKAANESPDLAVDRFGLAWAAFQGKDAGENTDWDIHVTSEAAPDPCMGVSCQAGEVCAGGVCGASGAGAGGVSGSSGHPGAGQGGAVGGASPAGGVGGASGGASGQGGQAGGAGQGGRAGMSGSSGLGGSARAFFGARNEEASEPAGCGCRMAGEGSRGGGWLAVVGLGVVTGRRGRGGARGWRGSRGRRCGW